MGRRQRRGKITTSFNIPKDVQAAFKKILHDWEQDDDQDELKLPTELTVDERKYIHGLAWRHNIKSRSRGKGENRYLTLLKGRKFWEKRVMMTDGSRDEKDLDDFLPVLSQACKTLFESLYKKFLRK